MSTIISGTTGINNVTDATTQITTIANLHDLGVGQTWQDVTASRAAGVTYTNSTGKPIEVAIIMNASATLDAVQVSSNGSTWVTIAYGNNGVNFLCPQFTVPNGWYYRSNIGFSKWSELR